MLLKLVINYLWRNYRQKSLRKIDLILCNNQLSPKKILFINGPLFSLKLCFFGLCEHINNKNLK